MSRELVRVRDAMTADPVCVNVDEPAVDAARLMEEFHVSGLPALDREGKLVGIVTESDIRHVRATGPLWEAWASLRVRDLMSAPVLAIDPEAPLGVAARLMEQRNVHRLVVLHGPYPAGILTTSDLVRAIAEESGAETPGETGPRTIAR